MRQFKKIIAIFVCAAHLMTFAQVSQAQILTPPMPLSNAGASISEKFIPPMMLGVELDPANPLNLNFYISPGQNVLPQDSKEQQYSSLLKYFLTSLTIPEKALWVNLSPYEKDRIIDDQFGKTRMGMDLLAQDYFLKQLTASLVSPEGEEGKKFWEKVYERIYEDRNSPQPPLYIKRGSAQRGGVTDNTTPTDDARLPDGQAQRLPAGEAGTANEIIESFNKIWIVPEKAVVYEKDNAAWVVYVRLKVMLEEDYVAAQESKSAFDVETGLKPVSTTTFENDNIKQILHSTIIPIIEQEVNEGKNFAVLRQIVNSMVLAEWYKRTLKQSVLGQAYADQSKVSGIDSEEEKKKWDIYNQYLEAFQKGANDSIREEYDPLTQQIVARKYFSGGFGANLKNSVSVVDNLAMLTPEIREQASANWQDEQGFGLDQVASRMNPAKSSGGGVVKDDAMLEKDYSSEHFEVVMTDYYTLKTQMLEALDFDDPDTFKILYRQMTNLVEYLPAKLEGVEDSQILEIARTSVENGSINPLVIAQIQDSQTAALVPKMIRDELKRISEKQFSSKTQEIITAVVKEMAEELYDDSIKQKRLIEMMTADIQPMGWSFYLSEDVLQKNFSEWKDYALSAIVHLQKEMSSFGYLDRITKKMGFRADYEDEMILDSTVVHESVHKGIFKIPEKWETISYAADLIQRVRFLKKKFTDGEDRLGEFTDDFGEPALVALYQRGKEMGKSGQTGFIVNPGISDRKASYFSVDYLMMIVREIYESQGLNTDRLADSYTAQRAAAIVIGGILMGMQENNPNLKPLRMLKDFFDVLWDRYADPTEDNPNFNRWMEDVQKKIVSYSKILAGGFVSLVPSAGGFWNYSFQKDKHELHFVPTDLYPRAYDGENENDTSGRQQAAEERGLGQTFLAFAKSRYGKRTLISGLPADVKDHPAFSLLWDMLLIPQSAKLGVEANVKNLQIGAMANTYQGAGRWVMRVMRDRYDIGNPLVEEALFLSMPLHLQYLDSILYRRFNYDPATKSFKDPRVRNPVLEDALARTMGSATRSQDDNGWVNVTFGADTLSDPQLSNAIVGKIWPVYKELYDEYMKQEELWRAYQNKMKQEKQQAVREAFNQLTQEALQQLEQYFNGLSEEEKKAIQNAVEQQMQQMQQQFGNMSQPSGAMGSQGQTGGQGSKSQGGQGQPSGQMSQQGSAGQSMSPENIKQTLNGLEQQFEKLSSQISQMSQGLNGVKGLAGEMNLIDAGKAQELNDQATAIQNQVNHLLNEGRKIAGQAQAQQGNVSGMQQNLPTPEQGAEAEEISQALADQARQLEEKLRELQGKANGLKQSTQGLANETEKDSPNQGRVTDGVRQISDHIQNLQNQADEATGSNRDLIKTIHNLQEQIKQLQETVQHASSSESPSAKSSGESVGDSQASSSPADGSAQATSSKVLQTTPDILNIPGAEAFEQSVKVEAAAVNTPQSPIKPIKAVVRSDPEKEKAWLDTLTGLNEKQREELASWYRKTVVEKGQSVTLRRMVDSFVGQLDQFLKEVEGFDVETDLQRGQRLDDVVGAITSGRGFANFHPKNPLNIKLTLLIDTSDSMDWDIEEKLKPIDFARYMYLIFTTALLEHNDNRQRAGFDPIEFEISFFASDPNERPMIDHQMVREKDFKPQRVLYDGWKRIVADGTTQFSASLGKFTTRLIDSGKDEKSSLRVLIALTDEDVDVTQKGQVLGEMERAEENGARILIVPIVKQDKIAGIQAVHKEHPEQIILPFPMISVFERLNDGIMNALKTQYAHLAQQFSRGSDFAMMAQASMGERKPVEGYQHFFTQNIDGSEYLVFDRGDAGVEPLYFPRGSGGSQVQTEIIPDTPENENKILDFLTLLYGTDAPSSMKRSSDGIYEARRIYGNKVQVFRNDKDKLMSVHVFDPGESLKITEAAGQTTFENIQGLKWEIDQSTGHLSVSQSNGDYVSVTSAMDFRTGRWVMYEDSIGGEMRLWAYDRQYQRVLVLSKEHQTWSVLQDLQLPQENQGWKREGQYVELIGETGTGKDTIIRAASRLMNIEVYYQTGHGDMTKDELTGATRTLSSERSGLRPTGFNQALHTGAWFVMDEVHKLPSEVWNSTKPLIAGSEHAWPVEIAGIEQLVNMKNDPMGRVITTSNENRKGTPGSNRTEGNGPMQERKTRLDFYWQNPDDEAAWQYEYAQKYAQEIGIPFDENNMQDVVGSLVGIAVDLRLTFAGYSLPQKDAILLDWRLIDPMYRATAMQYNSDLKILFGNGPFSPSGRFLKRPPSPRVIKNIIRHFVRYPKDQQYRPIETVKMYYNFSADHDPQNTYQGALSKFESWRHDASNIPVIDLDEHSFKVDGDFLRIIPRNSQYWDEVRVPLHPQAIIRQGFVPEEVVDWLKFGSENILNFYDYLQAHSLEMGAIFVGDPGSGKSVANEAIQKLLNGAGTVFKVDIAYQTRVHELLFKQDVVKFKDRFTLLTIPRAMSEGQIVDIDEATQGRPEVLSVFNEILANRRTEDRRTNGEALKAESGFGMIFTVNYPYSANGVGQFTDDILERCVVINSRSLPLDRLHDLLSQNSTRTGLDGIVRKLNPKLIGVPLEGPDGQLQNWSDGSIVYGGIMGLIHSVQIEPQKYLPKDRTVSVRVMKKFVQMLFDHFSRPQAASELSQEIFFRTLIQALTLEGTSEQVALWHRNILDLMFSMGMFQPEAGKTQASGSIVSDGIDGFLNHESVIVQNLTDLTDMRRPKTGNEVLDKILLFLEQNTLSSTVERQLKYIQESMGHFFDETRWNQISLEEKIVRVRAAVEVYQMLRFILENRSDMTQAHFYAASTQALVKDVQHTIYLLVVEKHGWPDSILEDNAQLFEGIDDEMIKKFDTGQHSLDEMLFKMYAFFKDTDYFNGLKQKVIALIESADENLLEKIKVVLKKLASNIFRQISEVVDQRLQELQKKVPSSWSEKLKAVEMEMQKIKNQIAEPEQEDGVHLISRLFTYVSYKETLEKLVAAQEEEAKILKELSQAKSALAKKVDQQGDLFVKLPASDPWSKVLRKAKKSFGKSEIYSSSVHMINNELRIFFVGEDGKVLAYNLDGTRVEKVLTAAVSRAFGTDLIFSSSVYMDGSEMRILFVGGDGNALAYALDGTPVETALTTAVKKDFKNDSILSSSVYTDGIETRILFVGENGKVFAYALDGRPVEEALIKTVKRDSDGNWIQVSSVYTVKGETRILFVGQRVTVLAYKLDGTPVETKLIEAVKKDFKTDPIYSSRVYAVGNETRILFVGYNGKAFAYTLDGKPVEAGLTEAVKKDFKMGWMRSSSVYMVDNKLRISCFGGNKGKKSFVYGQKALTTAVSSPAVDEQRLINIRSHIATLEKLIAAQEEELLLQQQPQKIIQKHYGPFEYVADAQAEAISQAHGKDFNVFGIVPYQINNEERIISFDGWGDVVEFKLAGEEWVRDQEGLEPQIIEKHNGAVIKRIIPYDINGETRIISLDTGGGVFGFKFVGGTWKEDKSGLVALIKAKLKGDSLPDIFSYEMDGQIRMISRDERNVFEFRFNGTKWVEVKDGLAAKIMAKKGEYNITNIIPYTLNGELRVFGYSAQDAGNVFAFKLMGKEWQEDDNGLGAEIIAKHNRGIVVSIFPYELDGEQRVIGFVGSEVFEFKLTAKGWVEDESSWLTLIKVKHREVADEKFEGYVLGLAWIDEKRVFSYGKNGAVFSYIRKEIQEAQDEKDIVGDANDSERLAKLRAQIKTLEKLVAAQEEEMKAVNASIPSSTLSPVEKLLNNKDDFFNVMAKINRSFPRAKFIFIKITHDNNLRFITQEGDSAVEFDEKGNKVSEGTIEGHFEDGIEQMIYFSDDSVLFLGEPIDVKNFLMGHTDDVYEALKMMWEKKQSSQQKPEKSLASEIEWLLSGTRLADAFSEIYFSHSIFIHMTSQNDISFIVVVDVNRNAVEYDKEGHEVSRGKYRQEELAPTVNRDPDMDYFRSDGQEISLKPEMRVPEVSGNAVNDVRGMLEKILEKEKQSGKNQAMMVTTDQNQNILKAPGGIDLNAEHFDLEVKSDGAMMAQKIKIDPQSIHGLVPEIILIKSVPWPALFEQLR